MVQKIGEISTLIRGIPNADTEWDILVNPLPTECGVKLTNQTTSSRNLVYEITQAMGGMGMGKTVTEGTQLHGQGKSNLCGLFGINSGLRHALTKLTGDRTGTQVINTIGKLVEGGRTAQQIFNDNSKWTVPAFNVCSFQSMLCSLIAQVVPRSLEGLDNDQFLRSMICKQATILEESIGKLVGKTMFETEGWKRIPGCFRFMESFGLNPEHFELVAEKVIHPNSRGLFKTDFSDGFFQELYDDLDYELSTEFNKLADDSQKRLNRKPRNYFVSILRSD